MRSAEKERERSKVGSRRRKKKENRKSVTSQQGSGRAEAAVESVCLNQLSFCTVTECGRLLGMGQEVSRGVWSKQVQRLSCAVSVLLSILSVSKGKQVLQVFARVHYTVGVPCAQLSEIFSLSSTQRNGVSTLCCLAAITCGATPGLPQFFPTTSVNCWSCCPCICKSYPF